MKDTLERLIKLFAGLLVGPVAGFFLPRSEKLVNYLLKQQN